MFLKTLHKIFKGFSFCQQGQGPLNVKRYESVKSSLMRINNTNAQFSLARKECLTQTEECLKDMQRLDHRYNKITFGLALKSTNKNRMTFYFWTVAPQTQEESQMWNIVLLTLEDRIVTLLTTIRLEVGRDTLQIFLQPSFLWKINTRGDTLSHWSFCFMGNLAGINLLEEDSGSGCGAFWARRTKRMRVALPADQISSKWGMCSRAFMSHKRDTLQTDQSEAGLQASMWGVWNARFKRWSRHTFLCRAWYTVMDKVWTLLWWFSCGIRQVIIYFYIKLDTLWLYSYAVLFTG